MKENMKFLINDSQTIFRCAAPAIVMTINFLQIFRPEHSGLLCIDRKGAEHHDICRKKLSACR